MKITGEEISESKDWLAAELLHSTPPDIITQVVDKGYLEVKLVLNDVEVEPYLFNQIMNNLEEAINKQAKSLIRKELSEAQSQIDILGDLITEAGFKIKNQFNLEDYE